MKKTEGRKSHDTVPLSEWLNCSRVTWVQMSFCWENYRYGT
jgi:hypothetical protein